MNASYGDDHRYLPGQEGSKAHGDAYAGGQYVQESTVTGAEQYGYNAVVDGQGPQVSAATDGPLGSTSERAAASALGDASHYGGKAAEARDLFNPSLQQDYYYQDEAGNYYYYANQEGEMTNDQLELVGSAPTPRNLIRSYEFDDWEPQRFGWLVDIIVDTFLCKAFKVYLTILLWCGGVLLTSLGLYYSFALLYRIFIPPDPTKNMDLQSFAYLTMFFYFSFIMASIFCAWMDMVKNLWWQERSDIVFWGASHRALTQSKPPFIVYLCIIVATVPLPILWGVIEAIAAKQSLLYVAQRYASVSVLSATWFVVLCYIWFYWKALWSKHTAIKERRERDDFNPRELASKRYPEKLHKPHWYLAVTVLEEFGFDQPTLLTNSIVFTVGGAPLFALYSAHRLSTFIGDPPVKWGAISSIFLSSVYIVSWMSLLKVKSQWAVYVAVMLNVLFLIIGVIGCAVGGSFGTIAVVIILFVASHGLVARKRQHRLTRKEMCATFNLPPNREMGEPHKRTKRIDTYLFCCRDVFLDCLRCFDVKKHFGYRHPDIRAAERRYAITNIALRTDQKVLLLWWIVILLVAAFVIALGNAAKYTFTEPIAIATNSSVTGQDPLASVCSLIFNPEGKAQLSVLDLALLGALSYVYGANGDVDYATWFAQRPTLLRRYPIHLPPTLNHATNGINIRFSDYVDISNDFHFITLNSNLRGMAIFRDVDDWSESLAMQVAGTVAPLVSIWPENFRSAFVKGTATVRGWFPRSVALNDVEMYIMRLIDDGAGDRILLIGDQFNGGYAKVLSDHYGTEFVAFNAPGTKNMLVNGTKGTQLALSRSIWSYIDSLDNNVTTLTLPCDASLSGNKCGRIVTVIKTLRSLCGDVHGRDIVGI